MTASALIPQIAFTGTSGAGTLGPFSLIKSGTPVYFAANSQIKAYRYDTTTDTAPTLLVEGTDYDLTGGPNAGSLLLTSPQTGLLDTERLFVYRDQPTTQTLDLVTTGNFSSANLEARLDRTTEMIQELKREVQSTVRFTLFDTDNIPNTMPIGAVIDKLVYVTGTASAPTLATINSPADLATNVELVVDNIANVNLVGSDLGGADTIGIVAADLDGDNTIGTVAGLAAQITQLAEQVPLAIAYSNITGKPTTLAGYGITDAYTEADTDSAIASAIGALGLGTAATSDAGDFATAAQGALAGTAVQPGDLGTAAAEDVGYFATAAQGALADTATQPGDLGTAAAADLIDEDDMATDSATRPPSQQSVKAFVEAQYARGFAVIDAEKDYTNAALEDRIAAAISDASNGDIIILPRTAYNITGKISVNKAVRLMAFENSATVTADVTAFEFANPTYEVRDLSSSYSAGDTTINVNTMTNPPNPGDWFKIISDAVDPYNRDKGSNSTQFRIAEWCRVESSTSTSITIAAPLRFVTGISPTSTAGDEAQVDAYTTTLNARVLILDQTHAPPEYHGFLPNFQTGQESTPWNASCLVFQGFPGAKIIDGKMRKGYGIGIKLMGCPDFVVRNLDIANLTDNTSNGQYGYGIADSSGYGSVENSRLHTTRHGYTTNAPQAAADTSTFSDLVSIGRTVGTKIWGGTWGSGTSYPIDTHSDGTGITFTNSRVEGAAKGFNMRGQDTRMDNCITRRISGTAINILTEYDSGDTDDDFWSASKTLGPTSATVHGGSFETEGTFFSCTVGQRIYLSGNIEVRTPDVECMILTGSEVIVTGHTKITISDLAGASPIPSVGSAVSALKLASASITGHDHPFKLTILEGATLELDLRNATADSTYITGIEVGSSTELENNGTIILRMPDVSDCAAYCSGSGTWSGTGILKVSVEGDADTALDLNYGTFTRMNAVAIDGSGKVLTPRDGTLRNAYIARSGTANTGTGALQSDVLQVTGALPNVCNYDGALMRIFVRGFKTGSAATAQLDIKVANAATDSFTLPAAGAVFTLETSVYVVSSGAFNALTTLLYTSGGTGVMNQQTQYATATLASVSETYAIDQTANASGSITYAEVIVEMTDPITGFTG